MDSPSHTIYFNVCKGPSITLMNTQISVTILVGFHGSLAQNPTNLTIHLKLRSNAGSSFHLIVRKCKYSGYSSILVNGNGLSMNVICVFKIDSSLQINISIIVKRLVEFKCQWFTLVHSVNAGPNHMWFLPFRGCVRQKCVTPFKICKNVR